MTRRRKEEILLSSQQNHSNMPRIHRRLNGMRPHRAPYTMSFVLLLLSIGHGAVAHPHPPGPGSTASPTEAPSTYTLPPASGTSDAYYTPSPSIISPAPSEYIPSDPIEKDSTQAPSTTCGKKGAKMKCSTQAPSITPSPTIDFCILEGEAGCDDVTPCCDLSNTCEKEGPKWKCVNSFQGAEGTTTEEPTSSPVLTATEEPTSAPIATTTEEPSSSPISTTTKEPTLSPVATTTEEPTSSPVSTTTDEPTLEATSSPTGSTAQPTASDTQPPSTAALPDSGLIESAAPQISNSLTEPTMEPSAAKTQAPTNPKTHSPTLAPTVAKTPAPSSQTDSPTDAPTVAPTPGVMTAAPNDVTPVLAEPTVEPTADPMNESGPLEDTIAPEPDETIPPEPDETLPPITIPTIPPTPEPTESTPEPTESTPEPTESTPEPTDPPTEPPTAGPTLAPTLPPTVAPTRGPTLGPTEFPTPTPTPDPTRSPTQGPTAPPTRQPTRQPTPKPTGAPTISPTQFPTEAPSTPYPTVTPGNPTREPTLRPSMAPSEPLQPSSEPTISPTTTLAPSDYPTSYPTSEPTDEPTTSPTLPQQSFLVDLSMLLENSDRIAGMSKSRFQAISAIHIKDELKQVDTDDPLSSLNVFTIVRDQQELATVATGVPTVAEANSGSGRRLQQAQGPLSMTLDTGVSFRSTKSYSDEEVSALVAGAFNTDVDRQAFVDKLHKSGDEAFDNIEKVTVSIDGETLDDDEVTSSGDSKSDFPVVIVAAAAAGGGALFILAGLFFVFRRRRKTVTKTETALVSSSPASSSGQERISTDIIVEPQDDISTLGDPVYAPGGGMLTGDLDRDPTVTASIVSGDYDYAKAYGAAQDPPSVSTNTGDSRLLPRPDEESDRESSAMTMQGAESLFSDDSSFEQQYNEPEERFEVDAPAGKLGVVIDTPSGGVPVVHAIKDNSVLANRVKVGDRLVSVDGADTTALSAMQVSKLISIKSDNSSRRLVFIRSRTNDEYSKSNI